MANVSNSTLLNIKGIQTTTDAFVVIIKTEWNAVVTDELERGCLSVFEQFGKVLSKTIVVPGAVEIPFAINHFWATAKLQNMPDAFIAFGCVVRGGTPHFEYVCQAVTSGITSLNLQLPVPTIFGVLTVDTDEQAKERIGGVHGHKGEEAALTALKMIQFTQQLKEE